METPETSGDSFFDGLDRDESEGASAEVSPSGEAAPEPAISDAPAPAAAAPASAAAAPTPAASVPAAAPAAVQAPAAEPGEKMVPLSALQQERAAHERRIRELEARVAPPAAAAQPQTPAPAAVEPPIPDFTEDPKGYVDAQNARAIAALEKLKTDGSSQLEQQQRVVADVQLNTAIQSSEAAFAQSQPDYMAAIQHIRDVRAQQLQIIHPTATPEQISQQITAEERGMAAAELARGNNPYETAYKIAKTYGYQRASAPNPTAAAAPSTPVTPAVPAAKPGQLPPDVTLAKTNGSAPDATGGADEGEEDILAQAFSERYGRKRA